MKSEQKEIFENRVTYQNKATENQCPNCDDPLVFVLKDNYHMSFQWDCQQFYSCFLLQKNRDMCPNCPANGKYKF